MTEELKQQIFGDLLAVLATAEEQLDGYHYKDFLYMAEMQIEKDKEFFNELTRTDKTLLKQ